jgi:uncharacterized protein (TIRG00374 family)
MVQPASEDLKRKLRPGKIIIPVLIGLAVVLWLIIKEIDTTAISQLTFTWRSVIWISLAFLFLILELFFYVWRIRELCDKDISWLQSIRIIMLWEFTSAISPSTVGGTAVAVVFLNKEGISVGRSTSIVLLTSFLDELYFVVMFPVLVAAIGGRELFITSFNNAGTSLMNNLVGVAIIGYLIIFVWVMLVGYGLFFNPEGIKKIITRMFRLPVIRRWKEAAERAGADIVVSSREIKSRRAGFWTKAILSTFLCWTSRYLIINAILAAFFIFKEHILIFARQLVLWIMMIISPTPGGSGFAEVILGKYISDLIPADPSVAGSISLAMAVIWRIVSYYPLLIVGAFLVPAWIERKVLPVIVKKK